MADTYDVFISYPRKHIAEVEPIKDALEAKGLHVWFDTNDIQDYESITRSIAEGVANSKVLLAYYSAEYPRRRACQWELTVAFLAAQRKGDVSARILVVNLEEFTTHIHPIELRDALFRRAPILGDVEALERLAQSVETHLASIQDTLGDTQPLIARQWYGWRGTGSRRFVGRFAEMWEIHSGLHQAEAVSITGTAAPGLAQVYGLGGIGKSLLAEEYALRFGSAYPGGVFWLRAYGHDHTYENLRPEDREVQRDRQLRDFAAELGIDVGGRNTKEVEGALKNEIERRGQSCLWIVDDVPSDLDTDDVRRWFSPHPLASTLLTTRSRNFESIAYPVALDVLPEDDAYQLLTTHRQPDGALEDAAAKALLERLGYHALAVDVAGALLKKASDYWTFADLYTEMDGPSEDVLEFAKELRLDLLNGHEISITTTLLRSINLLEEAGKDFLRLASMIAASPIPTGLIAGLYSAVDGLDERAAIRRAIVATSQAESLSLCERSSSNDQEGTWTVHTLVSRTMRFKDSQLQRKKLIRQAAVDLLSGALQNAHDPVARQTYAAAVPHALEMANEPANAEEAKLLGSVANYENERGAYQTAEVIYRRQLNALRDLGLDEAYELKAMNDLALVLMDVGRLTNAEELQEEVVRRYTQRYGEEASCTQSALHNLGHILKAQGKLPEALSTHQKVLDVQLQQLDEDDPNILLSKHNVAGALNAIEEHGKGLILLHEVYEGRKRVLGEFHKDTLATLGNMATTLQALGKLHDARGILEGLLDHYRNALEEDHPRILEAMCNLALTLSDHKDFEGAEKLFTEALEHQKRIYGEAHEITLLTMGNLAVVLISRTDLKRAHAMAVEALKLSSTYLGSRHHRTLHLMTVLVEVLREQGDILGARTICGQVLDLYRSEFGDEAFATLRAVNSLATLILELGEAPEAQTLLHEGLMTASRKWGIEHMVTTTLAWNLYYQTKSHDFEYAQGIAESYLSWLCTRDPTTLSVGQLNTRFQIC